jgi:hypothetical protein
MSCKLQLIISYLKNRLGDRGGSEWESIQISPREDRQSPKITTKGSHTILLRSRSHNGPTDPRNRSQLKAKWKHNSRTKGLRQICLSRTDNLWRARGPSVSYGRPSVDQGRTVRIKHTELPETPWIIRTVCMRPIAETQPLTIQQTFSNLKTRLVRIKRRDLRTHEEHGTNPRRMDRPSGI